jgi:hypothetical protein
MKALLRGASTAYWRVRWVWWYLINSPQLPNERVSELEYAIKMVFWKAKEPTKGIPPSVRNHRRASHVDW